MKIQLYPPLSIYELGQRTNQEDSIYPAMGKATAADRLFLLCDGMGGHEHGEVASQTVCEVMPAYILQHAQSDAVLDDGVLLSALVATYEALDKKDHGGLKKMGTTLCFLYLHRGGVTVAHIGDSRIYHIRPSEGLRYQSRDHSLVYDLYQSGEIAYEEMATSRQKNIITRAIQPGADNRAKPDIVHITDVRPGDYFYLCSDGMLEQMSNEELVALLASGKSDGEKRDALIAATRLNHDNHSAHLLHVESVTAEAGDEQLLEDESTSRANALNISPVKREEEAVSMMTADADDVEVIASSPAPRAVPPTPAPPTTKRRLWPLLIIAVLAIVGFFGYALLTNFSADKGSEDTENAATESIHQTPSDVRLDQITRKKHAPQVGAAKKEIKVVVPAEKGPAKAGPTAAPAAEQKPEAAEQGKKTGNHQPKAEEQKSQPAPQEPKTTPKQEPTPEQQPAKHTQEV